MCLPPETMEEEGGLRRLSSKKYGGFSLAALLLSGCASQGPLRPPSLHLPAAVSGLAASRIGDVVDLRWTNPTRTTDGILLNTKRNSIALSAEVCREELPQACKPVGSLHVKSGGTTDFHDSLPSALASGPARVLTYRVRILNAAGKGGGPLAVRTLAGSPPRAIAALRAEPAAQGVALRWQADEAAAPDRVLIRVTRGDALRGGVSIAGGNPASANEALLAIEPGASDRGGATDMGARAGVAQSYAVSRTRVLRVGRENLSMSSVPALVALSSHAQTPPPAPPTGLQALANTLSGAEIDLVWDLVPDAVSYQVFRSEGGGAPALLTADPIRVLSYTDKGVRPGVTYRYSVSAVNSQGAAGARSAEIQQAVPQ